MWTSSADGTGFYTNLETVHYEPQLKGSYQSQCPDSDPSRYAETYRKWYQEKGQYLPINRITHNGIANVLVRGARVPTSYQTVLELTTHFNLSTAFTQSAGVFVGGWITKTFIAFLNLYSPTPASDSFPFRVGLTSPALAEPEVEQELVWNSYNNWIKNNCPPSGQGPGAPGAPVTNAVPAAAPASAAKAANSAARRAALEAALAGVPPSGSSGRNGTEIPAAANGAFPAAPAVAAGTIATTPTLLLVPAAR